MNTTERKNHIIDYEQDSTLINVYLDKDNLQILADEQLNELHNAASLYLPLTHISIETEHLKLSYKKIDSYHRIDQLKINSKQVFSQIIKQILSIQEVLGTRYVPLVSQKNIFVNDKYDVKFAFRGLRAVTTSEDVTPQELFNDCKLIITDLFKQNFNDQSTLRKIIHSENYNQLTTIIGDFTQDGPQEIKSIKSESGEDEETKRIDFQAFYQKYKMSILIGLSGLLLGCLLIYVIKVPGLNAKLADQTALAQSYHEEINNYEDIVDSQTERLEAMKAIIDDDQENAIKKLESIDNKDEEIKALLISQYKKVDSTESLEKALQISSDENESQIIEQLVNKNDEKGKEIVLAYESENPQIMAEQAYLKQDYEAVIEISKKIEDNSRIDYLAVKSFLGQKKAGPALKLAQSMENEALQKESLNLKKKQIKDNKDLKKSNKEKQIKAIDKQLKNLK